IEGISRAWQIADESTGSVLGDPAFVDVPVAELTDAERNAALAAEVADQASGEATTTQPAASTTVAGALEQAPAAARERAGDEARNTTHISVVDSTGTAVSMTNTLTHWFGSSDYHEGFFLNDQL